MEDNLSGGSFTEMTMFNSPKTSKSAFFGLSINSITSTPADISIMKAEKWFGRRYGARALSGGPVSEVTMRTGRYFAICRLKSQLVISTGFMWMRHSSWLRWSNQFRKIGDSFPR
jgi:hypothetical protein